MTNAVPTPGHRRLLRLEVADELRRRILTGLYPPGSMIPTEAELGADFSVSRTVIRDAVRILASQEMLEVRRGIGVVVTEPSSAPIASTTLLALGRSQLTVREVLHARAMLEINLVGEAAVRGTQQDWLDLQEVNEQFRDAYNRKDQLQVERLHRRFHWLILEAIHVPALTFVLQPLHEAIAISSLPPSMQDMAEWELETHQPLIDALRSGEPARARSSMETHFGYAAGGRHRDLDDMQAMPIVLANQLEVFGLLEGHANDTTESQFRDVERAD